MEAFYVIFMSVIELFGTLIIAGACKRLKLRTIKTFPKKEDKVMGKTIFKVVMKLITKILKRLTVSRLLDLSKDELDKFAKSLYTINDRVEVAYKIREKLPNEIKEDIVCGQN